MIGRLRGTVLEKRPPWLLVDVAGVGYELEISMTTLSALPATGEDVVVFTHLTVRDDAHLLYGFAGERERTLFRALIKVNGVGPRLALAILSGMDEDAFVRSVREDDTKSLTRLPGVGKKTAERLIIEMRDRLPDWEPTGQLISESHTEANHGASLLADAEAALVSLGYKPAEATRMLSGFEHEVSVEAMIKAALARRMAGN
ncbi:Holliday junction branch migration protein RuvA [Halomonas halocynthiae]|uniref:Holliday junction branch migration protein RuvA n=1 Tax=Halomonas halocynthiae TaxID=176290 RepID=UPI00041C6857|nr:Holliday junction branch migration protein RuvA [Halomonas halocynthiae]